MTLDDARRRDQLDPLAFARDRFILPDALIYLDGNSLGALPAATPARVEALIRDQWGKDLIASWNSHGWIGMARRVADRLAPIVGAKADELVLADSTSVCLFKLLSAAVRACPRRNTILTQSGNFPTDTYVAQGLADMLGMELRCVAPDAIIGAIGEDVAAILLSHVDYRTGAVHDMAAINRAAEDAGTLVVWDLSHSAGAIEVDLAAAGSALAVGCGYKYLNGGPGAPAFIYVAERLHDRLRPPLQGWLGHADPFAFEDNFRPADGIARFVTGTPPVIALAAMDCGLATFEGIAMADVAAKARALLDLFIGQVEARCGDSVGLYGPSDLGERGSHVCFTHSQGYAMMRALAERGVIGDFRTPDLMRFGFTPLYTRFEDAWRGADALAEVLANREWDQPRFGDRQQVS